MAGIPIKGTARGNAATAHAKAKARGAKRLDFTRDYFTALYADAEARGINADVLVAQWDLETGAGASAAWVDDGNPAGIAMFDDGSTWGLTFSPQKAARAHVTHMAAYLGMNLPADWIATDARWQAVKDAGYFGIAQTTDDLGNGRWATDPQYARKLRERYVAYWGEPPKEQPPVSIPFPAPPLRISITPYGNANRPKLEMASPSYITVHEVGNQSPGADEEMHRRFVHNGGGPSQVSFHFVVGPTEAIQLIPLDEAAWHASDGYNGTGNRDSVAIETIQIGDFNKTLWHLAWLINEIATNPGRFNANKPRQWDFSINKIKQHHDWAPDAKNCPQFIRDRGLWNTLMSRVDAWNAAGKPQPKPDPKPEPEPEPEKPTMPKLPKGLSIQMVRRLYNPLGAKDPDTNSRAAFSEDDEAAVRWLRHGIDAIPKGKDWEAAFPNGGFGPLLSIVRRGDGSRLYTFVGFAHKVAPAKDAA